MSAEWWVKKSLQQAGYSRSQAQCAAKGVAGSLSPEQLSRLRSAIALGRRPERIDGAEVFIASLEGQVDDRTRDVLSHYARNCLRRP